ncbi:MAG TPA: ABC transporter permease, partial [Candidatus Polarisedimenticolia bacterium]|nr:ABC transporter permease [Candidatus Polarisedimenticolia bacterium]
MMHRLLALLVKEVRQMARDRRTVVMSVLVPVALLLLFGFAVTFDIREIRLGVWDRDESGRSRALIRSFVSSGYFLEEMRPAGTQAAARALDAGRVSAVLIVPAGFERMIRRGEPAAVQVLLDGTDSSTAAVIQGHVRRIVQNFAAGALGDRLA